MYFACGVREGIFGYFFPASTGNIQCERMSPLCGESLALVKRITFEHGHGDSVGRRGFLGGALTSLVALLSACEHTDRQPPAPAPGLESTSSPRPHPDRAAPALSGATASSEADAPVAASKEEDSKQEEEPSALASLPRVYLAPLGEHLPEADVIYIQAAICSFYRLEVVKLALQALPKDAYFAPRARYRAEKILDFLEAHAPLDSHVIVGLTAVDISTTKGSYEDWGILGLASVGGGECVVSRFRAKRGAKDDLHTRVRLAKTVVHEVGHTLGLLHCPNYGCLMEDGKGTVTTTDHEVDLCDSCREKLGPHAVAREAAQIPWRI